MNDSNPVIVWFRNDLRLADHPALAHAAGTGRPLIPLWIDTHEDEPGAAGRAAGWWLHHALAEFERLLAAQGLPLVIRRGPADRALRLLVRETGADLVVWNRRWEPAARARDLVTATALASAGVETRDFPASLLWEPDVVAKGRGGPYRAFNSYWRRAQETAPVRPLAAPQRLAPPPVAPVSVPLVALSLLPPADRAGGLRQTWQPGPRGAAVRWSRFRTGALAGYAAHYDQPAADGTSRLSAHLCFGGISPRTLWADLARSPHGAELRRQLARRDFAHHVLHHFPQTTNQPLDARFAEFPAIGGPRRLAAWQQGQTGYPFVDAGMRQLLATGWLHNRVRVIAGAFLVKHLLVPWQDGAAWFRATLVDGEQASNILGWQRVMGCGVDALPFARIADPSTQGRRHDPDGGFVRRWLPELAALPDRWLQAPWTAPPEILAAADVVLGETYPHPLVQHAAARARSLAAWERLTGSR